ncbi:MAG: M48 family metallopeptidase [Oscillospiraceae bacterium]|nr:M48 family metallopeptidase [Oscillospiraceae bacterium]
MRPFRSDGIPAEIRVVRSSRKTLSASVGEDGCITVRAPLRLPEAEIRRFLQEKSARLCELLERQRAENERLNAMPPLTAAELHALADEAVRVIPERVRHYAALLGVKYGSITVRNQKTRWGSCSAEGNLSFNCLLMLAPPEVLDSVVVHELCHRLEMNHSARFYAAVYRVFPDYDRCRSWLKENGSLLLRRMIRMALPNT